MIKAVFKDKTKISVEGNLSDRFTGVANESNFNWDVFPLGDSRWSVIDEDGKSFQISLLKHDAEEKSYALKIDGEIIKVTAETEFDSLLKKLGISAGTSKKAQNIKAPMPGLVVEVCVKEGDTVTSGDKLLVLEAMKMENVIKASHDSTVKTVEISAGSTIEKGQVMITFE